MNVVMLSQDKKIFEDGSAAGKRMASYGSIMNKLVVVVFGAGKETERELASNVHAIFPGGANKLDSFFKSLACVLSMTKEKKYDLISAQDPFFIGLAGLYAAKVRHVPFQAQLHTDCFSGAYISASLKNFVQAFLAGFVLRGATSVRVVSERIAKSVRTKTRVQVSVLSIHVSRSGSDPSIRPKEFTDKFTALTVSRLTKEKQIDSLLLALLVTHDIDLIVVGEGPEKKRLERMYRKLGLEDRVRFTGWQDPAPYYAHADAYIQASRFEGYGMSLVEAALYGLPIVTTDVGIVGEMLSDEREALVVKGHPLEFAKALTGLKEDRARAAALGAAARKKAEASLVSEEEYLRLYKEALILCHF